MMPTQTIVNNNFTTGALSVTKSVAAATTALTVSNTDNSNTASTAHVRIETGGASGGDPFISYSNGVVNFSLGLDNSDSDAFIMAESTALGTTNAARCDSAGQWTYPLNACFSVHANSVDANNVTGTGTDYAPHFTHERFDMGSDFDTGTHIFTAPSDGIYIFTGSVYLQGCTIATSSYTAINTTSHTFKGEMFITASNTGRQSEVSCIVDMTAGDTAYLSISSTGEAADTDDFYGNAQFAWFMGAMVA